MLCVVGDNRQTIVACRCSNQDVEISHDHAITCQFMTNLCIITEYATDRYYRKGLFYHFRLLQMPFYSFTVKCTKC